MRTTIEDNGYPNQEAFLDQPMRSPKPSSLINVTGVVPEAFEEPKPGIDCAIYQRSKHLDLPYEDNQCYDYPKGNAEFPSSEGLLADQLG